MVYSFQYLGRTLTAVDNKFTAIVTNLRKARKVWARLSMFIGREVADANKLGRFYIAVVQETILFGS